MFYSWIFANLEGVHVMKQYMGIEERGDVTVVEFCNLKVLDEGRMGEIAGKLYHLVDQEGAKNIVLDFRNLDYMSSAALGKIITLNKKCKEAGGKLVICELPDEYPKRDIYSVFLTTHLNKFFGGLYVQDPKNIGKTLDEALKLFSS